MSCQEAISLRVSGKLFISLPTLLFFYSEREYWNFIFPFSYHLSSCDLHHLTILMQPFLCLPNKMSTQDSRRFLAVLGNPQEDQPDTHPSCADSNAVGHRF